jgi:transketolase C-terminal domain/subunit
MTPAGAPQFGEGYTFVPGKDELVRPGTAGYIVTFGDAVYRCLDAVERLKKDGIDVGLINKPTLNVVDEDMMAQIGASPFVLVVEPLSRKNGLGSKFGTWLLERGLSPKYQYIGTAKEGCGGLWEHAYHQGYDSKSVMEKVKSML